MLTRLAIIHFPSHNFTAKNIHYHVQIKEPTNDRRGAVRYIPGPHFTGSRSRKSIRFCLCTFGFCFASVAKLIIGFQYTVKAGFRTQINSLIGQHGHNLTGRQTGKPLFIADIQNGLLFYLS